MGLLQTLIMVIDSYRQESLSLILSDDIIVEMFLNLTGLGHFLQLERLTVSLPFLTQNTRRQNDVMSLLSTVFTDISVEPRDEQLHLVLASSAEITNFLRHL